MALRVVRSVSTVGVASTAHPGNLQSARIAAVLDLDLCGADRSGRVGARGLLCAPLSVAVEQPTTKADYLNALILTLGLPALAVISFFRVGKLFGL